MNEPAPRPTIGNWALGLFLAAALLIVVVATALVWIGPLAIAVGVFAFAGLHYLIWGWWLSKAIRDEVDAEQAAQREPGPKRD